MRKPQRLALNRYGSLVHQGENKVSIQPQCRRVVIRHVTFDCAVHHIAQRQRSHTVVSNAFRKQRTRVHP